MLHQTVLRRNMSYHARGACSLTVAESRYLPGYDHRGIHVVLPSERLQSLPLCHRHHCPTLVQQRVVRLGPSWLHSIFCYRLVLVSLALALRSRRSCPFCCRRESLPRRRLAHRARSRALRNLFVNVPHGILAVAFGCAILFLHVSALCDAQLEPSRVHRNQASEHFLV